MTRGRAREFAFLVVALVSAPLVPAAGAEQEQFFYSNGVRIRFIDEGRGVPILLPHGKGRSLDTWRDAGGPG
jgi:hypothetical protein